MLTLFSKYTPFNAFQFTTLTIIHVFSALHWLIAIDQPQVEPLEPQSSCG